MAEKVFIFLCIVKENFVFRGTFIPDSEDASAVHMTSLTSKALAPPGTEDLQRKSKNASAIEGQKGSSDATVSNARSQESWNVLRQSDNEGPRIRDREARSGVPGGPGGMLPLLLPRSICAFDHFFYVALMPFVFHPHREKGPAGS